MQSEHSIQNEIRLKLSEMGYFTERINVGRGFLIQKPLLEKIKRMCPSLSDELSQLRHFDTGAVKGRSDLSAIKDGRIYFLEVKTEKGKPSPDQVNFIEVMQKKYGCPAAVVRSVDDAVKLVTGESEPP